MMKKASEMSRQELNELCSQYQKQLEGPMRQKQLAINSAREYFSSIPDTERTPEVSALEELFSGEDIPSQSEYLLNDLKIMRGEFATPELQDEFWFDFQHIMHVDLCRLEMYYPFAQKIAAQYGFELYNEVMPIS